MARDSAADDFVVAGDELPEILVAEAAQEHYVSTILEADFDSSSFGSEYAPTEPLSDSTNPASSFLAQEAVVAETPFEKGVEYLRARCQVLASTKTLRRSAQGDGPALATKVLSRISTTHVGWCNLANLAANKPGGYPQVSWQGFNKFATIGEVVLWADSRHKPATPAGAEGVEVSHLCHQPRCTVASHLTVEGKTANGARKGCVPWTPHQKDCTRCNGRGVTLLCAHEPPCIRYHDQYASQQDFLASGICLDQSEDSRECIRRRKLDSLVGLGPKPKQTRS
jgi:hypothetical protein